MIEHINEVTEALQFIPLTFGWVGLALSAVSAIAGASQKTPEIKARAMTKDEKQIIARMEELSLGNEELGQRYAEFTKRAVSGEPGFSPGLEKDLAEQEAKLGERAAAVGLPRGGTAAAQVTSEFETGADVARGTAREEMMQLGEQLMTARTARLTGAAGTALAPLAAQREEEFGASVGRARQKAGQRAGLIGLAGQVGAAALTSGGSGTGSGTGGGARTLSLPAPSPYSIRGGAGLRPIDF
jgi:hypothetical protein